MVSNLLSFRILDLSINKKIYNLIINMIGRDGNIALTNYNFEFKKIKSFNELDRFDSLNFIKMLIKIESKFQVSFKNENFQKLLNKKYLEKKIISKVKK